MALNQGGIGHVWGTENGCGQNTAQQRGGVRSQAHIWVMVSSGKPPKGSRTEGRGRAHPSDFSFKMIIPPMPRD